MRNLIKISLAAGIVAAVLVVGFNPSLLLSHLPADIARPAIPATKMTMTAPKLSGFTCDGRCRYELTAKTAAQDFPRADGVNLEEPRVSLETADGRKLNLWAATGVFDLTTSVLTMRRDVVLAVRTGIEIHLSEAVVDMRNNTLISEQPFEIESEQNTLRGNRLEISESGTIVIVDGTLIRSGNILRFDRYALP